jgi:uncharacterized protein HemY
MTAPMLGLGVLARRHGDYALARSLFEQAVGLRRQSGSVFLVASAHLYLGDAACCQGDFETARSIVEECLAVFRELEQRQSIAQCLELQSRVEAGEGRPERAACLMGAAAAHSDGFLHWPIDRHAYHQGVDTVRAALGEARFAAAWATGQAMPLDAAVAYALGSA